MVQIGEVMAYGGSTAPKGHLICDGASYLRADYPSLFAIIGTSFGSADGTHFNVPATKGSVIVGYKSTDTNFDVVGETGGANTANLAHSHTQNAHTHTFLAMTGAPSNFAYVDNGSNATWQSRSDHTHSASGTSGAMSDAGTNSQLSATQSIVNPYITLNFIIRYKISPSEAGFFFNLL